MSWNHRFARLATDARQDVAKIAYKLCQSGTESSIPCPSGSHERLLRFAQMQTDHDGVVGVAL